MPINKLLTKSSFILFILVSLQSSQAQNTYLSTQNIIETGEIMNIVDPSEIINTEVLIKDLMLNDDELHFHEKNRDDTFYSLGSLDQVD